MLRPQIKFKHTTSNYDTSTRIPTVDTPTYRIWPDRWFWRVSSDTDLPVGRRLGTID